MDAVEQAEQTKAEVEHNRIEKLVQKRIEPPKAGIAHCVTSQGAVSMWWAQRAMGIQWENNTPRLPFWIEDNIGNMVAEARNEMVARVLVYEKQNPKMEVSHIFWQDDDVVLVSPKALKALLYHDEDICSGVYFTKGEFSTPLIYPEKLRGPGKFLPNECFEVWGCGSGLTLVKMDVYRRMLKELDLGLDCRGHPKWYHTSAKDEPKLVDGAWDMGGTEDLYFCDKASQLGYKPVIDCGLHAFGFHYDLFGDYGPKKTGYPKEQWDEYRKEFKITWPVKDGEPVVWR